MVFFLEEKIDGRVFRTLTKEQLFSLPLAYGPKHKLSIFLEKINPPRSVNCSSSQEKIISSPIRSQERSLNEQSTNTNNSNASISEVIF